jgi:CRP-like cAMP-binding protein
MNTSSILSQVGRHITLDETETQYFTSLLIPRKLKQGEFLEESGDPSRYMIHVHAGCLMTYYTDKEGFDHVIQFSTAGWWTGDLHSLTKKVPSISSTKALTDSEVFLLPSNSLEQLLEKNMKFERYFRIIFQNSLVTYSFRIIQGISATAEERYLYFREKYPSLEQYVPLKYIASYLGMTPEFLSKIRRKLMNHKS